MLDIDSAEIAGCLQKNRGTFNFVLYDTTPGGAGHVKRINTPAIIQDILRGAFDKANNCTCGGPDGDCSCYNCLRTYQNQQHHDEIKRKYVIETLKDVY